MRISDWSSDVCSSDLLRAGAFKSVVRPNISKLAPRFVVEENDDGEREGEFGNPALKPYKAWNVDLSAEWYFGKNAVVQGGFFWKRIEDFIVDREFDADEAPYNGVLNGVPFTEALIPLKDRKSVGEGKGVAVRVDIGGGRIIKKKK